MTADEARKLNDEYAAKQSLGLDSVYRAIKSAATKGQTSVSISLKEVDHGYRDRVYENLRINLTFGPNPFEVKRSTWSDQRDNSSGDDILIRW
tara:strand:- start:389 stop:667 length:279 start_codon:yes stop_codon:yes gene_type:complete